MSNLIDSKYIIFDELITILVNSLSYYMYEGIYNIYTEGTKNSCKENNLKNFQLSLEGISDWNSKILDNEVNRIKNKNKYNVDLQKLLEASMKAYINLFTLYDITKFKNIMTIEKYIHNCYIECSKEFYFNPYLFYYENDNFQLKKNQLESISIINKSIKNVLRQSVQLNIIIDDYLHDNNQIIKHNIQKDNFTRDNFTRDNFTRDNFTRDNFTRDNFTRDKENDDNYECNYKIIKKKEKVLINEKEKDEKDEKNEISSKNNFYQINKKQNDNKIKSQSQIKNIRQSIKNSNNNNYENDNIDGETSQYILDGINHIENYNDIKFYKNSKKK